MRDINKESITINTALIDALKTMDTQKVKTLFVYSDSHFEGILTVGDIQRAIINNKALDCSVSVILEKDKVYGYVGESRESILAKMRRLRAEVMPIINEDGELVDVWFWDECFNNTEHDNQEKIDLPVVIMAGGKGTRLKPLTNVIPKPLIPVGDKTIIEVIMDQFESIGCKKFYISVNYKVEMLKFYLSQLKHHYDIEFFQENKPLGTIGSVSLLKGTINSPFIVSNCDIVIDQDYRDVYEYHINNKNEITLITAVKSNRIPYGVIETGEDGLLTGLKEKPETTFMFNTGVYILNSDIIDEIPGNSVFHITDLMEKVKSRGGRIGCFPVSEHSWKDLGDWDEYLRFIGK